MLLRQSLCIYNFIKIVIMRLRMKKYTLLTTVLVLCGQSYNAHSACSSVNTCRNKCDQYLSDATWGMRRELGLNQNGGTLQDRSMDEYKEFIIKIKETVGREPTTTCDTENACIQEYNDLTNTAKDLIVDKLRLARQQHGNAKGLSNENELIQIYKRCIFLAYNAAPHLFPDAERPVDPDQQEEIAAETSRESASREGESLSHEPSGRTSDRTIDDRLLEGDRS